MTIIQVPRISLKVKNLEVTHLSFSTVQKRLIDKDRLKIW